MPQSWETVHTRGVKTLAVWYMDPTFEIDGTTMAEHQTRISSLPTLGAAESAEEADLADAREERNDLFAMLAELNVRVPNTINGAITDDDNLHGQLDLVYAAGKSNSQPAILRRARLVNGLWEDYNAKLAALVPPKPALTFKYLTPGSIEEPEVVTQAAFATALSDALASQTTVANEQREWKNASSALGAAERRADRDNKRWFQAWIQKYPEGTPEGDAALSQVPREETTPPPEPLEIASATLQSGNTVQVQFDMNTGDHATKKHLLYKLGSEANYGHAAEITGTGMFAGPFTGGQTVTFITSVANSRKKDVLGTPVAVVIPA